jgi:type VII secretion integral membrane protein EccD
MMSAMATRFTRLSVVAGQRQLDASVPASRPVAEFLPLIPAMLSLETTNPPTVWALSTPRHGVISPDRTLDDLGVLDGDVVYLSASVAAAESPMAEDMLGTLAETVDTQTPAWRDADRDRVVSNLLGLVVIAAAVAAYRVAPAGLSAALVLVLAALCVSSAALPRTREGLLADWGGPLLGAVALFRLDVGLDVRVMAGLAGAGAGLGAVALVRRRAATAVFGIVGAILAVVGAVLLELGVSASALAGWASPGLVLALGVLPQLALSTSGLVALVARGEAGDDVSRAELTARLRGASARVDGCVTAVGAAGALAAGVLVWTGQPASVALGLLLGLLFALRSRGFASATLVGWSLAVPVVALSVAVYLTPQWTERIRLDAIAAVQFASLLVTLAVVALVGYTRLRELNAARVTRLLDVLDTLATIAFIPLVLLSQNVFGWLIHQL